MYYNYFEFSSSKEPLKGFKILNSWSRDNEDTIYQVKLFEAKSEVACVCICIDDTDNDKSSEVTELQCVAKNVYENFDKLRSLPKIGYLNPLLQYVYDTVCESDSNMCYIDYDEWEEVKKENDFGDGDLDYLTVQGEELGLKDFIEIDNGEYRVLGYMNLVLQFNDNRHQLETLINPSINYIQISESDKNLEM